MSYPLDELGVPEPTADIVDRIKYLIKLSRRTQAQFSDLINIDPSNLSKVLSRKMLPTEAFINRVVVNLGVSKRWLTEGTDIPFPKSGDVREVHLSASESPSEYSAPGCGKGAPVYDIDVAAGCTPLARMFTEDRIIGRLNLPDINPDNPVVRVTGDSMSPRINSGAYLSIRPIRNLSTIAWGQIYVVIVEDYRFVKYVRRHPDRDYVVLHSANPDYDDIELPRRDILGLYLVETILNYDVIA